MEYKGILFEKKEAIARITINRPEVLNSVNQETALSIQAALDECAGDESIRCIVLTGAGRAFCAGQDLGEVTGDSPMNLHSIVKDHYNPIVSRIRHIEKPVICAVNGVAAGAGANIAIACDIVVAASSASFIQAFSKIGLIPDSGGTYTLPRLVGFQKASALMMLGDKIVADEAEKMGMIYKCVEDADFESYINTLAERVAAMPTKALSLTKKALNLTWQNGIDQQLAVEEIYQTQASESFDYNEGVNSFMEKRKPVFKGR